MKLSDSIIKKHYLGPGETSWSDVVHRVVDALPALPAQIPMPPEPPPSPLSPPPPEVAGMEKRRRKGSFEERIREILLGKYTMPNSPISYNIGRKDRKQRASACYILPIEDSLVGIMEFAITEMSIFAFGGGSGVNISSLRHKGAPLSTGGESSGPIPFMHGLDAFAGAIKSGGKTRRAAKMVMMDADHPDIEDFVQIKADSEKRAHDSPGNPWQEFQNANHSVRVTDDFMKKATSSSDSKEARLLRKIAEAAHACGDPGVQFHTTINKANPTDIPITGSNPCSEYMFLDNTACLLSAMNLPLYLEDDETVDLELLYQDTMDVARFLDLIIDISEQPNETIQENTRKYRPIGVGLMGLGEMLMRMELPYNSDAGHEVAEAVAAVIYAATLDQSTSAYKAKGSWFEDNKSRAINVNRDMLVSAIEAMHEVEEVKYIDSSGLADLMKATFERIPNGIRNAQLTCVAPNGTTGLAAGLETTGCEPYLSLAAHKTMIDGSEADIIADSAKRLLDKYLGEGESLSDPGVMKRKVRSGYTLQEVLETALGDNAMPPYAHLVMMGALQPFQSGAISKTVNMPHTSTVEDVMQVYIDAWKMNLKSVAVYRDGCKTFQPLTDASKPTSSARPTSAAKVDVKSTGALDWFERSYSRRMSIGGYSFWLHVIADSGAKINRAFVTGKQNSSFGGMIQSCMVLLSKHLSAGNSVEDLRSLSGMEFTPNGITDYPGLHTASSIPSLIVAALIDLQKALYASADTDMENRDTGELPYVPTIKDTTPAFDGPVCMNDGSIMIQSGSCYVCTKCGDTTGCS